MGGALPGRGAWHRRGAADCDAGPRLSEPADHDARAAAEAAARRSYGKLVALLTARSRDLAAAEDALSEAFAAALSQWPTSGVPDNPEGWLLAVARRRDIDASRRRKTGVDSQSHLILLSEEAGPVLAHQPGIPDERLGLMFACAHPAIDPGIRAPLILQTVLGFDAATIASAFLVPPATMAQRLVRAKSRIKLAGIPFRIPDRDDIPERLDAVLAAIYATFAEGWGDATGAETERRNLAREGIWLGRLIAALMPQEGEALGLLALMLFAESRLPARRDSSGAFVPLARQDVGRWDWAMIAEAETHLRGAGALPGLGRYQIEAAVQAVHAARRITGLTDWSAIAKLYEALGNISSSPVVTINRAIAVAETEGTAAGLALLDTVAAAAGIDDHQPYWAARAELLARLGHIGDASAAFDRAIGLATDIAARAYLVRRKAEIGTAPATRYGESG